MGERCWVRVEGTGMAVPNQTPGLVWGSGGLGLKVKGEWCGDVRPGHDVPPHSSFLLHYSQYKTHTAIAP